MQTPIICLRFVFSLNITAQITLLKIVLPILYMGNKITAGIFPASEILSILRAPTKVPLRTDVTAFRLESLGSLSSLFKKSEITKRNAAAKVNANVKSEGNSLANRER